jgi:hypothetical protein
VRHSQKHRRFQHTAPSFAINVEVQIGAKHPEGNEEVWPELMEALRSSRRIVCSVPNLARETPTSFGLPLSR